MARKIILVIAALIVPGGFIALGAAWLLKLLQRTERGRKVLSVAQQRVPAWAAPWRYPAAQRQAA